MEEKKGLGIVVKILTIAFALALVAFVVFFSIQLYRSTIFDLFDEVYITDNLKDAYEKNDNIRTHSVGTEGLPKTVLSLDLKILTVAFPLISVRRYARTSFLFREFWAVKDFPRVLQMLKGVFWLRLMR